MSSEPPEEPHLRSEPNVLSPASPKPLHFPVPTNIPVLEMQMDVGFNQTEAHMSDPATRNTEVRADFWRDPAEEQQQNAAQKAADDYASPFSVGGEEATANAQEIKLSAQDAAAEPTEDSAHNDDTSQPTAATAEDNQNQSEGLPVSTSVSNGEQAVTLQDSTQSVPPTASAIPQSSDPSVPTAEAASTQATANDQSSYDPAQSNVQSTSDNQVDFQALLDTLQPAFASAAAAPPANAAPQADGMTIATTLSPSTNTQPTQSQQHAPGVESSPLSASALGAPPSGLPPRPPPQEQPLIHPNYVHSQHIRDYHPHAAHSAFQPHTRSGSNVGEQTATTGFVPPVPPPTTQQPPGVGDQSTAPYVGASYASNGSYNPQQLPGQQSGAAPGTVPQPQTSYPYAAYAGSPQSQQAPSAGPPGTAWAMSPTNMFTPTQAYSNMSGSPIESRRENRMRDGQKPRPEDRPWDAEVQRKYDRFIEEERRYVSEGRWEMFPADSRLFVGNLSSEKVTKRDIFHVFHLYGDLAQISIKQAYGFVQFLRTEDCMRALASEEGTVIRDKKIHLEISKPQKKETQNTRRRSRSPPNRAGSNVDRYTSGGSRGGNNRNDRRDGYRPGYRSPSPRGYRDRYDDRYRARSRSPDRYGRNGRYRSPSPRREVEDDLPLPRRSREQVPDVQIISLDPLDRDFITWVEKAFSSRGVKVDVLLLSPRLSEQAVIQRQIVEGVIAVVRLTRQNQTTSKIRLQVFDRSNAGPGGTDNVRFSEYDDLDPSIAAELVLREKAKQVQQPWGAQPSYPPPQQQYGQPQQPYAAYGAPPQYSSYSQPPAAYQPPYTPQSQQPPPNLQSLITNLDQNNLQSLISSMGTPQSANQSAGGYAAVPPNSAIPGQTPQGAAYGGYVPQAPLPQAAQPQSAPGTGGQVNMQEILARLGSYQQR